MKTCFFTLVFCYTCILFAHAKFHQVFEGNPTVVEGFTTGGDGRPLRFKAIGVDPNDPFLPPPFPGTSPTVNVNTGVPTPTLPSKANVQTYCSTTNVNAMGCTVFNRCELMSTSLDTETCSMTTIVYALCQTQSTAFSYCSEVTKVCATTPDYCTRVNTLISTASSSMTSKATASSPLPGTPTTNINTKTKATSASTRRSTIGFLMMGSIHALVMWMGLLLVINRV